MNPEVTLIIKHRDGRTQEITTKEYSSGEEALHTFLSIHKKDILEEGWKVELKK
jgi:hypothetical protein